MKNIITFILLLPALHPFAQAATELKNANAFVKEFNLKLDTAYWLCEYDDIAWWTSDSVYATPKEEQAKLGSEWFCIKQNNVWHAIYGKYQNNQFDMVYHYEVDSNRVIKRVYATMDSAVLHAFCRALINANKLLSDYPDSIKVRFNQYIRSNADHTISVWLLPAFTSNSIAVYGGEFYYLFDATGKTLLTKSEYSQGYKGFKPDTKKEIWLDYEKRDEPTLGAIFFIWYYRKYFDRIIVNAKKIKSTLFHDDQKGYYWVHAMK